MKPFAYKSLITNDFVTPVPFKVTLTEGDRVRRVARLTRYCIDNIACYRAGWAADSKGENRVIVQRNFWLRANGKRVTYSFRSPDDHDPDDANARSV